MPSRPGDPPSVSVVVTTHATPAVLLRAGLDSLADQTLARLAGRGEGIEVVLVADGPLEPAAADVVAEVSERVRLVLVEPGRVGRGRALNLGVAAARAPLVAVQDADDASHPRRLELQRAALEAVPRIGALGVGARLGRGAAAAVDWPVAVDLDALPLHLVRRRTFGGGLLGSNPIVHSGLLVRRRALERVGGYDERRRAQFDYDLLLRLAADGAVVARLDVPLVLKRVHEAQWFEGTAPFRRALSSYHLQQHHVRAAGGWAAPGRSLVAVGRLGYQLARSARRAAAGLPSGAGTSAGAGRSPCTVPGE